ncbi:unnamed protein product [Thlaspi arvense]|uniref:Uncharacterized protein n=1 Tax=Thlaspi arvense TaxID=13288 RepID=A0AAU9SIK7_THLAR|nr:unnamed protein product [Thlaspi arvense]
MAEQQQDHHKELQLLPSPPSTESPLRKLRSTVITTDHHHSSSMIHHDLDLKLSISLSTIPTATVEHPSGGDGGGVEALKWQAAEQIRLAAIEKAYAERVRELTRREMEMAQSEFAQGKGGGGESGEVEGEINEEDRYELLGDHLPLLQAKV